MKESREGENRVPLIPSDVKKLVTMGVEVLVEANAGSKAGFSDAEYQEAGASVLGDRAAVFAQADLVMRINPPSADDCRGLRKNAVHVSLLDPFLSKEPTAALVEAGVTSFALDMMPRSTYAQKMDVISSQASLGGYVAVILAAGKLNKILPMMMTPAGTIKPSRVFILGAGVAGLQAIATAKRLGAHVDAFDVRPEATEQIESLGAKAVRIDLGETESTKDGYAKEISEEQKQIQKQQMLKVCSEADIVITTAQVFGRKAPVLVDDAMLDAMKPGSVIIDMAVSSGGNVVGSQVDQEVDRNGVTIIGFANLPGFVARHASQMFSSNLVAFVTELWDAENKTFQIDADNEIIRSTLITEKGKVVNERVQAQFAQT